METCEKIGEFLSWLVKVMLKRSPSKEHKEAWIAYERDRMKIVNFTTTALIILSCFIYH